TENFLFDAMASKKALNIGSSVESTYANDCIAVLKLITIQSMWCYGQRHAPMIPWEYAIILSLRLLVACFAAYIVGVSVKEKSRHSLLLELYENRLFVKTKSFKIFLVSQMK